MKKYIAILLVLILAATGIYFYCDKSSKSSCVRNLDKYNAALKVILEHKDEIIRGNSKPKTKWEKQIIRRESIEKIYQSRPEFQNILELWDNGLISNEYGVMINNDWQSIDFDLPDGKKKLCYLPSNEFTFTCASGQIQRHERLEKNWYYVYYCPE